MDRLSEIKQRLAERAARAAKIEAYRLAYPGGSKWRYIWAELADAMQAVNEHAPADLIWAVSVIEAAVAMRAAIHEGGRGLTPAVTAFDAAMEGPTTQLTYDDELRINAEADWQADQWQK